MLPHAAARTRITEQHTVTHCNTLQHTATHCNTLQHALQHSLQHTVTGAPNGGHPSASVVSKEALLNSHQGARLKILYPQQKAHLSTQERARHSSAEGTAVLSVDLTDGTPKRATNGTPEHAREGRPRPLLPSFELRENGGGSEGGVNGEEGGGRALEERNAFFESVTNRRGWGGASSGANRRLAPLERSEIGSKREGGGRGRARIGSDPRAGKNSDADAVENRLLLTSRTVIGSTFKDHTHNSLSSSLPSDVTRGRGRDRGGGDGGGGGGGGEGGGGGRGTEQEFAEARGGTYVEQTCCNTLQHTATRCNTP